MKNSVKTDLNMILKKNFLLTPFRYIDGFKALTAGLIILAVSGLLAFSIQFRYDGFLDFHGAPEPDYLYLLDPFINWIIFALLASFTGLLYKRPFRVIDMLGMTAVAFFPNILSPPIAYIFGLSGILPLITDTPLIDIPKVIGPYMLQLLLSSFLMLAVTIWFIYLTFQAFQTNLNLKKTQSIIIYILLLIVTEIITVSILRSY